MSSEIVDNPTPEGQAEVTMTLPDHASLEQVKEFIEANDNIVLQALTNCVETDGNSIINIINRTFHTLSDALKFQITELSYFRRLEIHIKQGTITNDIFNIIFAELTAHRQRVQQKIRERSEQK
jgi:predicted metal-dependent hydrolase